MGVLALLLVLISACIHATWNLMAKREQEDIVSGAQGWDAILNDNVAKATVAAPVAKRAQKKAEDDGKKPEEVAEVGRAALQQPQGETLQPRTIPPRQ